MIFRAGSVAKVRVLAVATSAAMALLAACGSDLVRSDGERSATPAGESDVGSGVGVGGSSTTVAGATGASTTTGGSDSLTGQSAGPVGQASLRVIDPDGPGRSGIRVTLTGPVVQRLVSAEDGVIRVTAPLGNYDVKVVTGCTDHLRVTRGATARLAIAATGGPSGNLTVEASLRYVPTSPTWYRPEGKADPEDGVANWRRGEVHVVAVTMQDVCKSAVASPGSSLSASRFEPGEGVEIVGAQPSEVGPDGRVDVKMRCTGEDADITLDLVDADVPHRRFPVLVRSILSEQGPPICSS